MDVLREVKTDMDNENIKEEETNGIVPEENAETSAEVSDVTVSPAEDTVSESGYTERDNLPGRSSKKSSDDVSRRNSRAFVLLAAALVACICFSAFQTIYIFGLTTGKFGNMTYTNGRESRRSASPSSPELPSELADPEFSLELAASVYDPDKETLSTVEIANRVGPATVSIYIVSNEGGSHAVSAGSGFIISEEGYVVTNEHVVAVLEERDDLEVEVVLPDHEQPFPASVVGTDEQTDVAVIKIESDEELPVVALGDSNLLQTGELLVVIGNSLGTLSGSVTVGVVSSLGRLSNNGGYTNTLIQTDAAINDGNSGGPMINSFGEVVGITNAKMSNGEGLGFGIPISDVKDIIQSLINYGYVVDRPYFGVSISYVSDGSFFGAIEGVFVADVDPGSPAEEAGLEVGDQIISLDGIEITDTNDIIDIRNSHAIGDVLSIVIERNNREIELSIRVGDSHEAK